MLALPYLLADFANEDGLIAIGGDLRPERLLQAYRNGVFPWYDENEPICWWSPNPRAIFELNGLHVHLLGPLFLQRRLPKSAQRAQDQDRDNENPGGKAQATHE